MTVRIGQGFDVHAFCEGRPLILGGVEVPYEYGLAGHSDADVAIHALCDALLGAAALGDIGQHFPDTDDSFKGVDSRVLLREVMSKLEGKGFRLGNADLTIIAERPKLATYLPLMQENLANDMSVESHQVNLKATTTEKLGFTGRKEGIAVMAVVLLVPTS